MKDLEEEIVDIDDIINIVNETKILIKEDKYKNYSIKGLWKVLPEKNIKLEDALPKYTGENDLEISKPEISDNNWNNLTKKISMSNWFF